MKASFGMTACAVRNRGSVEDTTDLRILEPKRIRLFRVAGVTRLTYEGERSWLKADSFRAFPISEPGRYIGFLDGNGKDIGLVVDPAAMDSGSRLVLEEELELRYFVPVVRRVEGVKEEFGTVYWTVETDKGRTEIIARNLRDNIQYLSANRVLVTDVDGSRYEFADVEKLGPETQGIIERSV